MAFKDQLRVPFFVEIIVLLCWSIWIVRNDAIFQRVVPMVKKAKCVFWKEFAIVIHQAKKKYFPIISLWLEARLQSFLFSFSLSLFLSFVRFILLLSFFNKISLGCFTHPVCLKKETKIKSVYGELGSNFNMGNQNGSKLSNTAQPNRLIVTLEVSRPSRLRLPD